MHEFSIALNILDIATAETEKAGARKVTRIEIEIGDASGVMLEALEFAMQSAIKNTVLEDASIVFFQIESILECNACHKQFKSDSTVAICPQCGELTMNVLSGRELKVKSITVC